MIDAREAAAYNASLSGKLWHQSELPVPYSLAILFPPGGEPFAHLIAAFQIQVGLKVDGKLGSDTLSALRTSKSATPAPTPGETDNEDGLVFPDEDHDVPTPARSGVSNCFRIHGRSVPAPPAMLAAGIGVSNFVDDGDHRFAAYRRKVECQWFVFHESVSMSQKATIRTLEAKRARSIREGKNGGKGYPYGVQLICAPDGHLSCHADLLDETVTHASQLNRGGIGCEWVNPYNPKWAKPPFTDVIPAPWWCWVPSNAKALYTLPTPAQLLAAAHLTKFLPTVIPGLPLSFPTMSLGPGNGRIKGWQKGAKPLPGFVAHRDFSDHADGRYILEHVMQTVGKIA